MSRASYHIQAHLPRDCLVAVDGAPPQSNFPSSAFEPLRGSRRSSGYFPDGFRPRHHRSGTTFTLMIEVAGYAPRNNVGIYNASEVNPAKYLVLPGAASAGWTASCQFGASGQLVVRLFDHNHVLQGITNYAGVDRNNFGFYLEGPAGTFWSQDVRNPGGKPQALTFAATGAYAGQHWQCFEDLPYASSDIDYQDAILLLYQTQPTAVSGATWSRLKELYR